MALDANILLQGQVPNAAQSFGSGLQLGQQIKQIPIQNKLLQGQIANQQMVSDTNKLNLTKEQANYHLQDAALTAIPIMKALQTDPSQASAYLSDYITKNQGDPNHPAIGDAIRLRDGLASGQVTPQQAYGELSGVVDTATRLGVLKAPVAAKQPSSVAEMQAMGFDPTSQAGRDQYAKFKQSQLKPEDNSITPYQNAQLDIERQRLQNQKAPAGYQFGKDGNLAPIPGGPADPNGNGKGLGGRESVMFQRVVNSANSAATALQNISELPVGASTGTLGVGSSPGHSVLGSTKSMLLNKLASQDVQDYNTMLAGVSRNLSTIETAGLAPNGSLTQSMDAIQLREGDTEITKLRKMAEMRQIVEKGIEANLANPKLPNEQKQLVQSIIDQTKQAIPFTQHDITELVKKQAKNPAMTLQDLISQKGLRPANAAASTQQPAAQQQAPATNDFSHLWN